MPFKLSAGRRHRIPEQASRVTNLLGALLRSWHGCDASLRQRGSLTAWFTGEAIAAWTAEPRTARGGQQTDAPLTALALRAVFRLALRQTEGLIGSVIRLPGLDPAVPGHSMPCRRAETLEAPQPRSGAGATPLLVDGTGSKRLGAGEWLHEKHGTTMRRSRRKLRLSLDAGIGQVVASLLTAHDADEGAQAGALLDQVPGPIGPFTGDGAYDQDGVAASVAERCPAAAIIVPPRADAVPSETAETAPIQRDRHLQQIAEHGRMARQAASGCTKRARAGTAVPRFRPVTGDGLRSRTDRRRATGVDAAVHVLTRMLELGRPNPVRIA